MLGRRTNAFAKFLSDGWGAVSVDGLVSAVRAVLVSQLLGGNRSLSVYGHNLLHRRCGHQRTAPGQRVGCTPSHHRVRVTLALRELLRLLLLFLSHLRLRLGGAG